MRKIDTILIHCSATMPTMDIGRAEIAKWHKERGFDDIGYHHVINRHGEAEQGRSEIIIGAHAQGYNENSIGICLIGGVNAANDPENNFTPAQMKNLAKLVKEIKARHKGIKEIIGHNEISKKSCPCFDVQAWRKGLGL